MKIGLGKLFQYSEKFEILLAFYIFLVVASETLGFKLIGFGQVDGWMVNLSVASFFLPFIYSINDMVTEVYGVKKTLSMSRLSLVIIFCLGMMALIFTNLPPSPKFLASEAAYDQVFGFSIRASLASLTAFAVAQWSDVFVFAKIRQKMKKSQLWLRNNLSNLVSLFIDTAVFMIIARYNFNETLSGNIIYLVGIILPYWGAKMLVSLLATPLVYRGVMWLKS